MSDPVTNVEIEDVLSSIRRLVREGGGAVSHTTPPVQLQTPAAFKVPGQVAGDASKFSAPPPGRFVLTPALRVAEAAPQRDEALPEDEAQAADDVLPQASDAGEADLDQTLSEVVQSDFVTEEMAQTPIITSALDDIEPRMRASDRAAGLELAVTARTGDWEPDGSEDVPVMDWAQTMAEDAPIFRSRQSHPARIDRDASVIDPEQVMQSFLRDIPADARGDPPADAAPSLTDSPGTSLREDFAAYLGSDKALTETALRALIVQIVHEELQGSLGERITRNVRKLVRREINRMIVSDDLD